MEFVTFKRGGSWVSVQLIWLIVIGVGVSATMLHKLDLLQDQQNFNTPI